MKGVPVPVQRLVLFLSRRGRRRWIRLCITGFEKPFSSLLTRLDGFDSSEAKDDVSNLQGHLLTLLTNGNGICLDLNAWYPVESRCELP